MSNVDIYNKIFSKTNSKEYISDYLNYLNHCTKSNRYLQEDFYTEIHHILPRSIWPEYKNLKKFEWNAIKLTAYQHVVAHWFLSKIFHKMKIAYGLMIGMHYSNWKYHSELRKDKTLYIFQDIKTGKCLKPMIRYDFMKKYKIEESAVTRLVLGKQKCTHGWCIFDEKQPNQYKELYYRLNKPSMDTKKYIFWNENLKEKTNPMTRCEFCEYINVGPRTIRAMFKKKDRAYQIKGWSLILDEKSEMTKKKYESKIIFIKESDGFMTHPMTRKEFSEFSGIAISSIGGLVAGRLKTCKGWKIKEMIGYQKRS